MNTTSLKLHQRTCVAKSLELEYGAGQFCYPTGTGKTLAEAHVIIEHIKAGDRGIYIVLVPRIMLGQQLFAEIWTEVVAKAGIDCSFFSLHSGRSPSLKEITKKHRKGTKFETVPEDDTDDAEDARLVNQHLLSIGITQAQLKENFEASTSTNKLRAAAERADSEGRPLIVISTYHSSERITSAFEETDNRDAMQASMLIADEAHNAVSVGFTHVHDIPANKRFYFTATRKLTDGGEDGLGMQNCELFGAMLDALSPFEAVQRGLIVRPRVHYVEIEGVNDENETDADAKAIEAAFIAHSKVTNGIGAKLLVASRGTMNIQQIIEHSKNFARLRATRPNFSVFDISSQYGPRVNGTVIKREEFLAKLQALKDADEAIILHYDILSEGIDVPGITGVMPLRSLGTSKFLQTLGRATRLHLKDRARLNDEATAEVEAARIDWFTKPCAWLVLPCYGSYGSEIQASAETYVRQLRTFGWIPGEDDLLTEAGGEAEPLVISEIHPEDGKLPKLAEAMGDLNQRFEDREAMVKAYEIEAVKPVTDWI